MRFELISRVSGDCLLPLSVCLPTSKLADSDSDDDEWAKLTYEGFNRHRKPTHAIRALKVREAAAKQNITEIEMEMYFEIKAKQTSLLIDRDEMR